MRISTAVKIALAGMLLQAFVVACQNAALTAQTFGSLQ